MHPTPVGDRMAAYLAKMRAGSDSIAPVTAGQLATMARKMRAIASRQVSYQGLVKTTLATAGVSVIDLPFYGAFAHEVAAVLSRTSGESAAMEVSVLVQKWTARGLTQSVLFAIRTGVFNVSAPVAP